LKNEVGKVFKFDIEGGKIKKEKSGFLSLRLETEFR